MSSHNAFLSIFLSETKGVQLVLINADGVRITSKTIGDNLPIKHMNNIRVNINFNCCQNVDIKLGHQPSLSGTLWSLVPLLRFEREKKIS